MGTRTTVTALCLWLALIPTLGSGKNIYVDVDAPGPNNGTSWANAFKNLQDAIVQAAQSDEIWVAQGVYRPDKGTGQTAGDRTATFKLKNGVKIYGGYAGYGQPKPNSRDILAYPTVLSGDLKGNDAPIDPTMEIRNLLADTSRQDNSYVVVTGSETDATALLSGFAITGGLANSPQWPTWYAGQGAALFIYKGSPTIQDCTFRDNLSIRGGAAVACRQANPSLVNCTFTGNRSQSLGGALSNWSSSPVIRQCLFSGNRSDDNRQDGGIIHITGFGGAIYNFESRLTATSTTFDHNGGCQSGGAICNDNSSDANLVDCRFVANSTRDRGGAVENLNGSTMTLTRCLFLQNTASIQGAAVQSTDAKVTMNQCRFNGNTAGFSGGALHNARTEIKVFNSVFTGNTVSDLGGAIANDASDATIINCTFAANTAALAAAIGLDSQNPPASRSVLKVYNSILWDRANEIASRDGSGYIVNYSDVFDEFGFGGWTVWANEHNMSKDPRFVDPNGPDRVAGTEDDNLRLAPGSPCIDAGANARVPSGIVLDLDGKNRFVDDPDTTDTGTGQAPVVDMGAYEYVKRVPGPNKPVANAGPDRTVFAWLDNLARVTLDGSASTDPDSEDIPYLTYKWTWKIGTTNYQAEGVKPAVTLPVGTHTLTLVVNDGRQNSNADMVVITVLGPFTAKTSIQPEEINRNDPRVEYLTVLMQLFEIAVSDIDNSQALIMTPGQIPAVAQSAFDYRDGQTFMTTIMGLFEKEALMKALSSNGGVTLTITGKLTSGRSFSGAAPVTIVGTITPDVTAPVPNPMEWAKADLNVKDPNAASHWPGEPRAVLLDPRADGGTGETGWAIAMRAAKATDPKGGIEYQFDCFEDDKLDRTWSADPNSITSKMKRTDVVKYTFRCRARNRDGGMTAWSKWAWVAEVPKP